MGALYAVVSLVVLFAALAGMVVGIPWLLRTLVEGNEKCPHCRKRVPRKATVCGSCARELPVTAQRPTGR